MTTKDDQSNPQPAEPSGSGGGGTPEPAPEPIKIPPKIVTYSEPDLGTPLDSLVDMIIRTGKE